jgi:hypothetical protein
VTGVDDILVDGNVPYTIVTAAAVSVDTSYNGLNAANVSVTNNDNDIAGITVTPTSGLVTTEAGGTATFTVVLNSQPTDNVTIGLSSSDLTEGTVSPASLIFTTANWGTPQTVTVTGVDDILVDGNVPYTIVTAAAVSVDTSYNGLNAANVSVTNNDNDIQNMVGFITGGGNVIEGKTVHWTFAGNVGNTNEGLSKPAGEYQITDHQNNVSWHCNNKFDSVIFDFAAPPASSPPAPHNKATFKGHFTSNKGSEIDLRITIVDGDESGVKGDYILVEQWDGDSWEYLFGSLTEFISSGNLQVHEGLNK